MATEAAHFILATFVVPISAMSNDRAGHSWIVACAVGEAAGIAVVALGYALVDRGAGPPALLILVAGAVEGTALSGAQSQVLRTAKQFSVGRWMLATIAAAVLGYAGSLAFMGSGPSGGDPTSEPPLTLLIPASAGIGFAMGLVLGAAQAWAGRNVLRSARSWILRNAAGWAVGMVPIFLAATSVGPETPLVFLGGFGALAGALAGAAIGIATRADAVAVLEKEA